MEHEAPGDAARAMEAPSAPGGGSAEAPLTDLSPAGTCAVLLGPPRPAGSGLASLAPADAPLEADAQNRDKLKPAFAVVLGSPEWAAKVAAAGPAAGAADRQVGAHGARAHEQVD